MCFPKALFDAHFLASIQAIDYGREGGKKLQRVMDSSWYQRIDLDSLFQRCFRLEIRITDPGDTV